MKRDSAITRLGFDLIAAGTLLLLACTFGQGAQAQSFTLSSATFKDGEMLAVKNAGNIKANPNCVGDNVSPPLSWTNVPEGTKSFALVMIDTEGRAGLVAIHMVTYGIPAGVSEFAENELSAPSSKFISGKTTPGVPHYFGPCPPPRTGWHHYNFTLIATDLDPTALQAGQTRDELLKALEGHTKGAAGLVGRFGKP
jgi:Raf kinase inhibitor-like YbhB/YbcL family protein